VEEEGREGGEEEVFDRFSSSYRRVEGEPDDQADRERERDGERYTSCRNIWKWWVRFTLRIDS